MPDFLSKDGFAFKNPTFQYNPSALLLIDKSGKVLAANPQFSRLFDYQAEDLINKELDTILTFSEEDYKSYLSYLTNPTQEVRSLEATLDRKGHSALDIEISGYPFFTSKEYFLGNILAFKDISLRKYNERLSRALFNIFRTANSDISLSDLYDIIRVQLNQIIFAENFHIALWDEEKNQITFSYFIDEKHELTEESDRPSLLKSLANYIIENGKPLLADYAQILKLSKMGQLAPFDKGKLTEETCWLGVPLKIGIHLKGCMSVANYTTPNMYSENDINSMVFLSKLVAAAIERKITEMEIHQNHEKFVSLFANNPLAAVYLDIEDRVLDINPRFTELFGYTKKDILGKKMNQFNFYPQGKKEEGEGLTKKTFYSPHLKFETIRRAKDGRDIPVQISSSQMKIKNQISGVIGLYEDITEKKQAEEEIRQTQERFESLFRSNPLAAIYLDKEDRVFDANPQFTKLFGFTREEMVGKRLAQLNFYPLERIKEGENLTVKAHSSDSLMHETYRRTKEGKDIPVQISTSQVKIKGQVQGFVALYQDITEQKQNETLRQVLYNISQAANAPIAISQLYRDIHTELKKIINATNFYIAFMDEEKDVLSFVYYSDEQNTNFSPVGLNLKDSVTHYLIKQQQSLLLNYNQIHGLVLEKKIKIYGPLTEKICWLGVPLKIEGKTIGAMIVQDYHNPTCYSEKDIKLMEIMASQVATALVRKQNEEKIIYISFHDSLTGLYNRAYFEEELKRMNNPRFHPLSVVMMDVNGLKAINDTFGHSQGDQLLKNLAVILKRNSREVDVLARLGGDEFAIILPNTTGSAAEAFCQRIANDCRQNNFEPLYLNPNISMGIATQEGKLLDYEAILREADQRMYQNKLLNVKSREKYLLDAFLSILSARDIHTEKHSQLMVNIAYKIGQRMGLGPYDLDRLRLLALLHDIGKIGIPENILFKAEPLTEEDWKIIKNHPNIGYRIAKNIPDFSSIANEILYHHERWDGKGYPAGLKEKETPLLSRIIGLVDAFDVMQSVKYYKKPLSREEAMEEIRINAGTQFDPELVKIFFEVVNQKLLK